MRLCKWLKVTGKSASSQGALRNALTSGTEGTHCINKASMGGEGEYAVSRSLSNKLRFLHLPTSHREFFWTQFVKVLHAGCCPHQRGCALHHALGTWAQTAVFLQQRCARVRAGPSPHHSKRHWQQHKEVSVSIILKGAQFSPPPLATLRLQVSEIKELSSRRHS